MTFLGDDSYAGLLIDACAAKGIGLNLAMRASGPSPLYLAIHDRQGEMRAAVNDTRALESLDPDALCKTLSGKDDFNACVLDANLSIACLKSAAACVSAPLIADPVSAVKSLRLLPVMDRLTAIKPNLLEAQAMTGENSPQLAAEALIRLGVKQVFISLGAEGVYYADTYRSGFHRASGIAGVSVTGAGDAMAAGITLVIAMGMPVDETALLGMRYSHEYLLSRNERPKTKEEI
jgi:pseudouridine kinase